MDGRKNITGDNIDQSSVETLLATALPDEEAPSPTKSPIEELIALSFSTGNMSRLTESKVSNSHKGNVAYMLIQGVLVAPYFYVAGTQMDTPNPFINTMAPYSIIPLVVAQSMYAADEVWQLLREIGLREEPAHKKLRRVATPFILAAFQTFPFSASALVIGRTNTEKAALMASVTITGLNFYLIPSSQFLRYGIKPIQFYIQYKMSRDAELVQMYKLKMVMKKYLEGACSFLKQNIQKAKQIRSELERQAEPIDRLTYLIQKGKHWDAQAHPKSPSLLFHGTKYICASLVGAFTMTSQSGYLCATQSTTEPYIEDASWPISSAIMLPLAFFAGALGSNAVHFIFNTSWSLWHGTPVEKPFSISAYPKTSFALAILICFLSSFGWADFYVTFVDTCPDSRTKKIFESIIMLSAGNYDVFLGMNFIETIIRKFSKMGNDDARIALDIIEISETLCARLDNSSTEDFRAFMKTAAGTRIQATFFQPPAINDGGSSNREVDRLINHDLFQTARGVLI